MLLSPFYYVLKKEDKNEVNDAILKTYFNDTAMRIYQNAMTATGSLVDESMFGAFISGIKKLTKYPLQNTMQLKRVIADDQINA